MSSLTEHFSQFGVLRIIIKKNSNVKCVMNIVSNICLKITLTTTAKPTCCRRAKNPAL